MRLTQWSDYTLRVLMYCAASQGRPEPVTISEIADAHGISRSHLTKVVFMLGGQGLLETTRGRGGGIRLHKPAHTIRVGDVIRMTETDFHIVECLDKTHNSCGLTGHCRLKGILNRAVQNFFTELDGVTVADLVTPFSGDSPATLRRARPGIPKTLQRVA